MRDRAGSQLRTDFAAADADVSAGRSPLAAVPDVDGSVATHLRELDRLAGQLLDQLFGHCVDYPTSPGERARWLREHRNQNRARRAIYATLADARQRMNATPHVEPTDSDWSRSEP